VENKKNNIWNVKKDKECSDKIKKCLKDLLDNKVEENNIDIVLADIPDNSVIDGIMPVDNNISMHGVQQGLLYSQLDKAFSNAILTEEIDKLLLYAIGSVKEKLDKNTPEKLLYKYKLLSSARSRLSKTYKVIFILLRKEAREYNDLFEYIISYIFEKVKIKEEFDDAFDSSKKGYLLKDFEERRFLLGKYANYFLNKNGLLDSELLIELSAARYEGSDSEARIYFTNYNISTVEEFGDIGSETRVICKENMHTLRKLLELSKRDILYLYAEEKIINESNDFSKSSDERNKDSIKKEIIISKLVKPCDEEKEPYDVYIKFYGFMHWSVIIGKKEKLKYYHGTYEIGVSDKAETYLNDIQKLKKVNTEMVKDLVGILKNQRHGTSVIISDYGGNIESVVDHLCEMNRGIKLSSKIRYSSDISEVSGWDKGQLLSITDIDGSLFMDLEGTCLAIGVIVDGIVTIKGDAGRGARYNSIKNYVMQKQKKDGNYIGIVISEDRKINIFQNNNENFS